VDLVKPFVDLFPRAPDTLELSVSGGMTGSRKAPRNRPTLGQGWSLRV